MRAPARIARSAPIHNRKPNNRRNSTHRDFIKQLPCVKCGGRPCDPAHVRSGTDGGAGLKPSDRFLVPLCRPGLPGLHIEGCHMEQHRRGELTFWAELGIDPVDLSSRLWAVSGDLEQGNRAIVRARQAIALRKI